MSQVAVTGNGGGTGVFTLTSPNSNTNRTLTLPDNTGTLLSTASAGTVLQVVSVTKTDTFTTTSTSLVDVTGVSASITPSSSSNKILVLLHCYAGNTSSGDRTDVSLFRGATEIGGGAASSSRPSRFGTFYSGSTISAEFVGGSFLDAPASTSLQTYKIMTRCSAGTATIGRTGDDVDSVNRPRLATTITLMEIAA